MTDYGGVYPPNNGWGQTYAPQSGNQPYPPQNNQPYPPQNNQPYPPQNNPAYPPQNNPAYPPQNNPAYPPQNNPAYPFQGNQPYLQPSSTAQSYAPGAPPPYQPGAYPPGNSASTPSAPAIDNLPDGVKMDMLPIQSDDDHSFTPAKPFDPVPGYGGIGFTDNPISPPPPNDSADCFPKERPDLKNVAVISEEEAKEALLQLSKKHCCWGNRAAKNMEVEDLKSSSAYQYCLETFCEMRSTAWTRAPYSGQMLDGPHNGQAPQPWQIPAQPPALFKTHRVVMEVPHTASSRPCDFCFAYGWVRCNMCHGNGMKKCTSCHGLGRSFNDQCNFCHGSGHSRCITCQGNGRKKCMVCQGYRNLKWFIQLTIDWINHSSDHIADSTALPNQLLRQVRGDIALKEENIQVFPITNCPVASVNEASNTLIQQHRASFPNERRIMQRQIIRIIPVTQATGVHSGNKFPFFVYGLEKTAHTTEYPLTCCCGCTLL